MLTWKKSFCKFVSERAREIVLDFIGLKLLIMIKLRSIDLLDDVWTYADTFHIRAWKLDGTVDVHFDNCGQEFREVVEKVRDDMYVDDLLTGEKV